MEILLSETPSIAVSREELLSELPELDTAPIVTETLPAPIEESREQQLDAMRALVSEHEDESLHQVESPDLEQTLATLRSIRDSNIQDLMYVDNNGQEQLHRLTDLPRHITASIASVKVRQVQRRGVRTGAETLYTEDGEEVIVNDQVVDIEIKFWNKNDAADKLMRYHGAYKKDNEQVTPNTGDEMLGLLVDMAGAGGLPQPKSNDA